MTFVPTMVIEPVTLFVSPTAVPLCPNNVSLTRYRTTESPVVFQVPASVAALVPGAVVGVGAVSIDSFGGGSL